MKRHRKSREAKAKPKAKADPLHAPDPQPLAAARTPQRAEAGLYEKWWFWSLIGGVAVLTTTITLIAVTAQPGPPSGEYGLFSF